MLYFSTVTMTNWPSVSNLRSFLSSNKRHNDAIYFDTSLCKKKNVILKNCTKNMPTYFWQKYYIVNVFSQQKIDYFGWRHIISPWQVIRHCDADQSNKQKWKLIGFQILYKWKVSTNWRQLKEKITCEIHFTGITKW